MFCKGFCPASLCWWWKRSQNEEQHKATATFTELPSQSNTTPVLFCRENNSSLDCANSSETFKIVKFSDSCDEGDALYENLYCAYGHFKKEFIHHITRSDVQWLFVLPERCFLAPLHVVLWDRVRSLWIASCFPRDVFLIFHFFYFLTKFPQFCDFKRKVINKTNLWKIFFL